MLFGLSQFAYVFDQHHTPTIGVDMGLCNNWIPQRSKIKWFIIMFLLTLQFRGISPTVPMLDKPTYQPVGLLSKYNQYNLPGSQSDF